MISVIRNTPIKAPTRPETSIKEYLMTILIISILIAPLLANLISIAIS